MKRPNPKPRASRVLIVDDSAMMRKLLVDVLSQDPLIQVVGTAPDAFIARDKIVALKPDLVVLNIDMPGMDGLDFLKKLMRFVPTPTLVISRGSGIHSPVADQALAAGARAVMLKPVTDDPEALHEFAEHVLVRIREGAPRSLGKAAIRKHPRRPAPSSKDGAPEIIAITASTGGTEALKQVLSELPRESPAIVIVQHMPPLFTHFFAAQLNQLCRMEVREARHGDQVVPGLALLAPGGFHMEVFRRQSLYFIRLHQEEPLHGVRPAGDILLKSVAQQCGARAIGLILTGMGRDGAAGLLAMHKAGAMTIVQDQSSSVVFGMPKAAMEMGAAQHIVPLNEIGTLLQTGSESSSRDVAEHQPWLGKRR